MHNSLSEQPNDTLFDLSSEDQIRDWLIERVAVCVQASPLEIDSSLPFADYGVGSTDAVVMSGDLESLLGRALSPMLLWYYPTIDALSRHLASE